MNRTLIAGVASVLLLTAIAVSAAPVLSDRLAMGLPASGDMQGELVELQTGESGFLAIFQPRQQGPARGGIVLLHDQGTAANSLEVIRPLRMGLPGAGWDTLSLQLSPDRHSRVGDTEVQARLVAGLNWLKARKLNWLAVIALGDSGAAALDLAADKPLRELQALVLVSAGSTGNADTGPQGRVRPAVLEIYAEFDRPDILEGVASRRGGLSASPDTDFTQRVVPGAQAGYFGLEDALLNRIRSWLAKQAGAQPAATD